MSDGLIDRSRALGESLKNRACRLVTAESCTGGAIAAALTEVSGSSAWFERGFIAYSNEAKIEQLGVKESTLSQHGAVSAATVVEMASGALAQSRAQWALAVSGIAGPGGGSAEKPVGTVWLALIENGKQAKTYCFHFKGDRIAVRAQTVARALEIVAQACAQT